MVYRYYKENRLYYITKCHLHWCFYVYRYYYGTKMKKIQKNYELNAGESFRLDKNSLHGVTAQSRFKMSLLRVFE